MTNTNSDPLPINQTATQVNAILKTVEGILVPVAESAIQSACPTLDLPVIKQIVDAIVQGVANELTKLEQLGTTFLVIDGQTAIEQSSMVTALKALVIAQMSGDPHAIAQAKQAFQAAQSGLVTDDGSATPSV